MEKTKIILDTDIGDDIDDALALALIMNSPELELLGVTTCFNNAKSKAQIARKLLDLGGRQDIPVYAGIDAPLLSKQDHSRPPRQYQEELKGIPVQGGAVEYLYNTLMEQPEPIILVTIGPLMNIAALLAEHPDCKAKIKQIVMMGGCFYENQREWNIYADAEAADMVFSSQVPILGVGLDVTLQCKVPKDQIQRIHDFDSPVCRYLSTLIKLWNGRTMFIHDPLAVMAVFRPDLLTMQEEEIFVETKGSYTYGMTYNDSLHKRYFAGADISSHVTCCKTVDQNTVLDLFMERILK